MTQSPAAPLDVSWFTGPPAAKAALAEAAGLWTKDRAAADAAMRRALTLAADDPQTLIAAYRFFFYNHDPATALEVAEMVMAVALERAGLTSLAMDWSALAEQLAPRKHEPDIRLYLNALAASGLLLVKLERPEEARSAVERAKAIEDSREICATTVMEVLDRRAAGDPDDDL